MDDVRGFEGEEVSRRLFGGGVLSEFVGEAVVLGVVGGLVGVEI